MQLYLSKSSTTTSQIVSNCQPRLFSAFYQQLFTVTPFHANNVQSIKTSQSAVLQKCMSPCALSPFLHTGSFVTPDSYNVATILRSMLRLRSSTGQPSWLTGRSASQHCDLITAGLNNTADPVVMLNRRLFSGPPTTCTLFALGKFCENKSARCNYVTKMYQIYLSAVSASFRSK